MFTCLERQEYQKSAKEYFFPFYGKITFFFLSFFLRQREQKREKNRQEQIPCHSSLCVCSIIRLQMCRFMNKKMYVEQASTDYMLINLLKNEL